MQIISIAANDVSIFIHLDKSAVTSENVEQTVRELQSQLLGMAEYRSPESKHPRKDISFLYNLPRVDVSAEIVEKYKNSTFSRQELYEDTERDEFLYGAV